MPNARFRKMNLVINEEENALKFMRKDNEEEDTGYWSLDSVFWILDSGYNLIT